MSDERQASDVADRFGVAVATGLTMIIIAWLAALLHELGEASLWWFALGVTIGAGIDVAWTWWKVWQA